MSKKVQSEAGTKDPLEHDYFAAFQHIALGAQIYCSLNNVQLKPGWTGDSTGLTQMIDAMRKEQPVLTYAEYVDHITKTRTMPSSWWGGGERPSEKQITTLLNKRKKLAKEFMAANKELMEENVRQVKILNTSFDVHEIYEAYKSLMEMNRADSIQMGVKVNTEPFPKPGRPEKTRAATEPGPENKKG